MGIEDFHLTFHRTGRVGAKCRVLKTRTVRVGDEITLESRPDHPVTIKRFSDGLGPAEATRLLEAGIPLAPVVRNRARRAARSG